PQHRAPAGECHPQLRRGVIPTSCRESRRDPGARDGSRRRGPRQAGSSLSRAQDEAADATVEILEAGRDAP
ncbi:hypothetical protein EMGR_007424, partial [Emarellia grisea]